MAWFRSAVAASATVLFPLAVLPTARAAGQAQPSVDACAKVNAPIDRTIQRICPDVRYLGFGTFGELVLYPKNWDILAAIATTATGRQELAEKRHFFAHGPFVFTVLTDGRQQVDMVVRTAAALDSLRTARPRAYEFITSTLRYPTAPPLAGATTIDRAHAVVISFDKTPADIAAGVMPLGGWTNEDILQLNSNLALVSIDEETILGGDVTRGSRAIYGLPTADANYRRYMTDGVIFSVVHEMAHVHITHLRGTSQLAATLYQARDLPKPAAPAVDAVANAEEIIANETAMALLGSFLSEEVTTATRRMNRSLAHNPGVRFFLARYAAIPVDARNLLVVPQ
jgi:hypothetical protein